MSSIARFYILHCVIGFAAAAAFTGLIMWFNVANLWHLVRGSDIGLMALTVFWVLNGIVFAGVQFAVAVMMMAERDNNAGPRGGMAVPALAKVRVHEPATRR